MMVAGVVYLSLMPSPPEPIRFTFSDKLEHAAGFAWLALWFMQIVVVSRRFAVAAALLLLGVAIEIAQSFTATRMFEAADIVADGAGIVVGAWLVRGRLGRMLIGLEQCLRPRMAGL
jgi:VanZ family protein